MDDKPDEYKTLIVLSGNERLRETREEAGSLGNTSDATKAGTFCKSRRRIICEEDLAQN
jgi:hypothetical protein